MICKIAVLIPCYNEEKTIRKVVADFKQYLPEADIYVYDNNSNDNTIEEAKIAGAIVVSELRQGKGNVVRSMFKDIDADIYVMVDGDDTYPADMIHEMIKPILENKADMVVGDRLSNLTYKNENKRSFHNLGNGLVKFLINKIFNANLSDIMTGYRAFNKTFVKNTPILAPAFEVETELTLHALDKRFRILEIPINYKDRPEGSFSKLNTFKDGFKVLNTILWIFKDYKPFTFFMFFGSIFFMMGALFGLLPIIEFLRYHFVYRLPMAILASGLMIVSILCVAIGLILDTVAKHSRLNFEQRVYFFKELQNVLKSK